MSVNAANSVHRMTGYPDNADASMPRPPLLVPLLVISLAAHAAVVGLWSFGGSAPSTPVAAGPISVRLQTPQATDARRDSSRTMAAAATSTAVATAPEPAPIRKTVIPAKHRLQPAPTATAAAAVPPAAPTALARPTETTATAATRRSENMTAAQVNSSLKRALIAHFDYPILARRRGWEGVVRVGVRVEADGHLSGLRVVASSGHALLDRAALSSLREVDRLNDAIPWLHGEHFDMVLPVHYRLIDS